MFVIVGKSGTAIPLVTNYFTLDAAPNWHLYQYHVDFSPEIDNRKMRAGMVKEHAELLGSTRAFDGMQLIIAKKREQEVGTKFLLLFKDL